jgi:hypothetical protein
MAGMDRKRDIPKVHSCRYQLLIFRTYFSTFCFLIQRQLLTSSPASLEISEVELCLPCSEKEWSAETEQKWWNIRTSPNTPPTPSFQEALEDLFVQTVETKVRYSEFGGFIMISAILLTIMTTYRSFTVPAIAVNFPMLDLALDNWQRSWNLDLKSHPSETGSLFSSMAFNASAIYRVSTIRRVKNYSRLALKVTVLIPRLKAVMQLYDETGSSRELLTMLEDEEFHRTPEMIRALVSACVSFQIPVKIGMKLVIQTASLMWSIDHLLCNLEVCINSILTVLKRSSVSLSMVEID